MKNIAVIAEDPSFGASANLVNALRQQGHKVTAIFKNKDPKGFWETVEDIYVIGNRSATFNHQPDKFIIVGSSCWDWKKGAVWSILKNVSVILTDTHYIRHHERLNKEFETAGATVFVMPDLVQYRQGLPTIPYYPPFDVYGIDCTKAKQFTICHSPGEKAGTNQKGTLEIRKEVEKFQKAHPRAQYIEITGKTHAESLAIKAKAHVFIDQLVPEGRMPHGYAGGIGKSGLEAMLLGCLVFTGRKYPDVSIPFPPVIYAPASQLFDCLCAWYDGGIATPSRKQMQQDWAKKYLSYEFVANHVLTATA